MSKDHLEMALNSIEAFQNGAQELQSIMDIAERDGVIDQNEIRVLHSIVKRVDPSKIDDDKRTVSNLVRAAFFGLTRAQTAASRTAESAHGDFTAQTHLLNHR